MSPMRRLLPALAALFVAGGIVISDFLVEPQPLHYLLRPLLAIAAISLVVGLLASFFDTAAVPVAVLIVVWFVDMSPVLIVAAVVLVVVVVYRLIRKETLDLSLPILAAAAVFFVVGAFPLLGVPRTTTVDSSSDEPARFLILLDGYPRADTLQELGVDISGFIEGLEARGFDYYPNTTSHHTRTYRTITYMLTGEAMAGDDWGTADERRQAREAWYLPGYVTIAPPFGSAVFLNNPVLNPGGFTIFEAELLARSALRHWVGDWVMDGLRNQLDRSMEILASTEEEQVFAHLLAPHTPFLYTAEGEAEMVECWPVCSPVDIDAATFGYTNEDWAGGIAEYLSWLNPRLLETVDAIQANHPKAEIVLFSDHGGRFDDTNGAEWHKTFLAGYTPQRPGVFGTDPRTEQIVEILERAG